MFIQEDGERTIFMAKGATSLMNHATINKEFGMQSHKKAIAIVYIMFTKKRYLLFLLIDQDIAKHSAMVTTEVSQVPLSGVLAILQAARSTALLSYYSAN